MQVLYERCCGLDVHKKSVTACLLVAQPDGGSHKTIRTDAYHCSTCRTFVRSEAHEIDAASDGET